ncbi:hypothetical protein [Actinoplanes sp. NPDC020271]|uniref:hypothetical protein n=1 Tax=Actinoplanes sp. NPDC020271 TaxID=3363896 RepID=UPI0037AEBF27
MQPRLGGQRQLTTSATAKPSLVSCFLALRKKLIMNNVLWGYIDGDADIMAPGEAAGDGRCETGEWGVRVEDVVVFGSRADLRDWAQSVLAHVPGDRRPDEPLIIVDTAQQQTWLETTGKARSHSDSDAALDAAGDLVQAIAEDPAAAGWTFGRDVTRLWAYRDDADDLLVGVTLTGVAHAIDLGSALTAADLTVRPPVHASRTEVASAWLSIIAERINAAY